MSTETRQGWRLVEVVVGSAVLLIAMGIALLWLTSCGGRESARRIHCANNLRQVGLAMLTLEDSQQRFPGYLNRAGGQPASWVVPSLAHLERMDLVQHWKGMSGSPSPQATQLYFLTCPSDPPHPDLVAPLSYVANAGIPDLPTANGGLSDTLANGVFQNRLDESNLPEITQKFLHTHDGASHTLLVGENVQAGQWAGNGQYDPGPNGEKAVSPAGFFKPEQAERLTTMVWHPAQAQTPVQERRINVGYDRDVDQAPTIDWARPSSNHWGGAMAGMADSRVQFLSEEIDYGVYVALMTPDGANSAAPDIPLADEASQTWRTTDKQALDRLLEP